MKDKQKIFTKLLKELRKYPSTYIEEISGIKLLQYQKLIIDKTNKFKFAPRNQRRKYNTYIKLLCSYMEMKDDGYIVIASLEKIEKLNKIALLEYLENYWK